MDTIEFKNQMMDLMRDISVNINTTFLPIISSYDLTIIQAQILREVRDKKDHNIGSLAKIMSIQNGNASFICKQLEKKGFLKRNRDKSDERIVKLELTNKGLITINEIDNILKEKYSPVFSIENSDELLDIILGLQRLKELLIKMNQL
ncbi:MarR family winged helix-turn-helix transcriptional regulator [Tissierella praeacuta]|uniref:MarR family winged helix-turn-helix transcriptional regulator n=1 Tax=Tissierella praeacuta TaxID=43131 RepID=UPI0033402BFA